MKTSGYGLLACLPILASLLQACGTPPPPPQAPPPKIGTAKALQGDVAIWKEWVGALDGMVNAQIRAQVTGYLIKRNYQEGDKVKKGQMLYEIDPRTFKAAVEQARATLAQHQAILTAAELDLARIQKLLPEKAVSVRDRDNAIGREASAAAEVMAAKAALDKAELDLAFTRIASPIEGIAGISQAQLGDLVGPNSSSSVLTTVSQIDPIRAYVPLNEQEYIALSRRNISEIKNPNEGNSNLPELPIHLVLADGSTYPERGKFFFTDRQIDQHTGTIQVGLLFPNPDGLLRPGQFARLKAPIHQAHQAILVPQRAMQQMQNVYQVAVVKPDHTIDVRAVIPGDNIGRHWVIIKEGIQPGEDIVVEGLQKVRPGMKVEPGPMTIEAPEFTDKTPGARG